MSAGQGPNIPGPDRLEEAAEWWVRLQEGELPLEMQELWLQSSHPAVSEPWSCPALLVARDWHQRAAFADFDGSSIFAACEMGTAKFEPEKLDRIAKFTPITFPPALNTGPPEPPEVVCAS
jgi:hypothetical protein